MIPTYTLGANSITCNLCRRTSYHMKDVEHRYCAHCKVFHEDLAANRVQLVKPAEKRK